jgi:hypothetical protein
VFALILVLGAIIDDLIRTRDAMDVWSTVFVLKRGGL